MITIHFDGACGPENPGGLCGGGAVIKKDNLLFEVCEKYEPQDHLETSNNCGEYYGLIKAFEYVLAQGWENEIIRVFGDSNLVISQMDGRWRIKKGIYIKLAKQAQALAKKFKNISFGWIPRERNEHADALSKRALIL